MARGRRPGQRAHKSGQRWHVGVRWSGLLGALLAVVTAAPLAVAGSRGPGKRSHTPAIYGCDLPEC